MIMDILRDVFARGSDQLVGRLSGPLNLRLVLTPTIVAFFAIRAGWKDARSGKVTFLWTAITDPAVRRERFQIAWASLKRVILMAFVIDILYQFYVFHAYFVFQTVLLVIVLAIIPYILIRGAATRLAQIFMKT
jgi:hypothetical protein